MRSEVTSRLDQKVFSCFCFIIHCNNAFVFILYTSEDVTVSFCFVSLLPPITRKRRDRFLFPFLINLLEDIFASALPVIRGCFYYFDVAFFCVGSRKVLC